MAVTKNDLKQVGMILGGFGTYVALAVLLPNGSIGQMILAGLMVAALVGCIIWFTALGNPIKRLIRKIQAKKEEQK